MKELVVDVEPRVVFGKNSSRRLRRMGSIPGIVYGSAKPPVPITVNPKQVEQVLRSESGVNTIFKLNLVGKGQRRFVMIKDYQTDPVTSALQHADFIRIEMNEAIQVNVPIRTLGEAPGVKLDGGIMDMPLREIRIESLPTDIPDNIDIDISELKISDTVRVSDLQVSDKVKILTNPSQTIVVITPPAKEVEPEAAEVTEVTEPEVIKKGKVDEDGKPVEEAAAKEPKGDTKDS